MNQKETANQITNNLLRVINMMPNCVAYRINNVGVWDAEKQLHRKGNTERGLPDIVACMHGLFVAIEVKAGKDKQSSWQQARQFEIEKSNGLYFVVRETNDIARIINFVKQTNKVM